MKCPNCGEPVKEEYNFCKQCGTKLKANCKCWVKNKDNYNCGESSCPGYGLFKIEKKINEIIEAEFNKIKDSKTIAQKIEEIHRDIRWKNPDLANYVKRRLMKLAGENSDLP